MKVEARPVAFIGPDSVPARNAALAAATQNRMYNFMQVVYFNQGTENTGWLTKDFITQAASSVPGMDVKALLKDRNSDAIKAQDKTFDSQATADQIPGTPTIFIGRTGGKLRGLNSWDLKTISAAVKQALR
jgi:protein-disulfide isomerase